MLGLCPALPALPCAGRAGMLQHACRAPLPSGPDKGSQRATVTTLSSTCSGCSPPGGIITTRPHDLHPAVRRHRGAPVAPCGRRACGHRPRGGRCRPPWRRWWRTPSSGCSSAASSGRWYGAPASRPRSMTPVGGNTLARPACTPPAAVGRGPLPESNGVGITIGILEGWSA